ncbi:hypothetical protein BCY84_12216 [Trypanosoma cruzi cruzi]|nr:hypothetical protein BCY84_12216 [Trypanosoma cruzi cruzi]
MAPARIPGEATVVFLLREYVIPIVVFFMMVAWLLRNVVLPMCSGNVLFTRNVSPFQGDASLPEAGRVHLAEVADTAVAACDQKVKGS